MKNNMKMGPGIFWGVLLLVLGMALLIKVIFNLDFPVVKIVIGLFFIFLGLRIMFNRVLIPEGKLGPYDTVFSERVYDSPESGREYNVIFGKGVYDFTRADLSQGDIDVKVNTVFGGTLIKISEETPVRIDADAVFAGAELPGGNTAAFGSASYTSDSYTPGSPSLNIRVGVVFGGVQVIRR